MRLGDRAFFNLCECLVAAARPKRECGEWDHKGVRFSLQRHSSLDGHSSFQIETQRLYRAGRNGWALLLVHEIWWGEHRDKAIRNGRWVHFASGSRTEALKWFAERQKELETNRVGR